MTVICNRPVHDVEGDIARSTRDGERLRRVCPEAHTTATPIATRCSLMGANKQRRSKGPRYADTFEPNPGISRQLFSKERLYLGLVVNITQC